MSEHRYKIVDQDRGSLEFLWQKKTKPTKKDFDDILSFFREQHPELTEEEEDFGDRNPDEMTMAEFTRWRESADRKRRATGASVPLGPARK